MNYKKLMWSTLIFFIVYMFVIFVFVEQIKTNTSPFIQSVIGMYIPYLIIILGAVFTSKWSKEKGLN